MSIMLSQTLTGPKEEAVKYFRDYHRRTGEAPTAVQLRRCVFLGDFLRYICVSADSCFLSPPSTITTTPTTITTKFRVRSDYWFFVRITDFFVFESIRRFRRPHCTHTLGVF